jgi:hypothetical protein
MRAADAKIYKCCGSFILRRPMLQSLNSPRFELTRNIYLKVNKSSKIFYNIKINKINIGRPCLYRNNYMFWMDFLNDRLSDSGVVDPDQ